MRERGRLCIDLRANPFFFFLFSLPPLPPSPPRSPRLSLSLTHTGSFPSEIKTKKKHRNPYNRQEKNRLSWAKEKLAELLAGVEGELAPTSTSGRGKKIRVSAVSSVEGDAYQSTRKGGKKLSAYDLKLELRWEVVAVAAEEGEEGEEGEEEEASPEAGDSGKAAAKKQEIISGDIKVAELATGHDYDDLLFEASTTHRGFEAKEALEALRAPLLKALAAFVAELEALEL